MSIQFWTLVLEFIHYCLVLDVAGVRFETLESDLDTSQANGLSLTFRFG